MSLAPLLPEGHRPAIGPGVMPVSDHLPLAHLKGMAVRYDIQVNLTEDVVVMVVVPLWPVQ